MLVNLLKNEDPILASLDLTYKCNIRCRMCNVWTIKRKEKELNLKEWKNIIDQLIADFSIQYIRLVGGEPLLSPHFKQIVHYIKSRDLRLTIVTNGTLINKDIAHFLVSEGVDRIRISLDGLQKTHDFYRGKGAFVKTMEGIGTLVEEKKQKFLFTPKIEIRAFVSKLNYIEMGDLLCLSKQIKADFNYHYMLPAINEEDSRAKDPGFPEDNQRSSFMSQKEQEYFEVRFLSEMSLLKRIIYILFWKIRGLQLLQDCTRSVQQFLIDPWGYVFVCELLYKYKIGCYRDKSLKVIWNSQKRMNLRNHIKKGDLFICQVCSKRNSFLAIYLTRLVEMIRNLSSHAFFGR